MKITHITMAGVIFLSIACGREEKLFRLIPSAHSKIEFENRIVENDSINPFDVTNIYNGAGVGIGDFNNDGLADIYFAGNQVASRLYLNKGNMQFQDITDAANVGGNNRWCRGVSVVDINNDGWDDLYVCATIYASAEQRRNLLYVNQGVTGPDSIPVFKEMSAEYGLNDDSHSTMAAFFDYDNDGDLDVYITVNEIVENDNPSVYRPRITDGSSPSTGRLYRNDQNDSLGHPRFTNVSKEAGITIEGYGHSACIADINLDGWKDIFVANDFLSNDLLYINNGDGTFTDQATFYFKHTSANGMGSDVIDINNDGLSDLVEMDMDPEDNFRKKLLMSGYNYQNYLNNEIYGYQYQYVRNTLQLNQGPRLAKNDSLSDPIFSEIGFYAGISSTDWSWAPIVQDFDNDGWRDIIITNGFPKDLTDHDFIAFREKAFAYKTKREVLAAIPQVKIKNYGYKNNSDLTFANVTDDWGLNTPSFSNGGVYADLDNDGDLDIVMSNINDKAFIYRNTLTDHDNAKANFISLKLIGDSLNRKGFGTWVDIYYNGQHQVLEHTPYRGFLSSVQNNLHFGVGDAEKIDSVVIRWPDNRKQVMINVPVNKEAIAAYVNASTYYDQRRMPIAEKSLFTEITENAGIYYVHEEKDFIDFNIQKLIPHKLSEYGPPLAAGDINNDSLEDVIVGGSFGNSPTILLQQSSGKFEQKILMPQPSAKEWEEMSIALFDADNDDDLDIYMACGSNEAAPGTDAYQDKLFLNDGTGNFRQDFLALPVNHTSKSSVRTADYDKDGDVDVFVAGRCFPWNYPKQVSSFVFRNDSRDGKVKFTDVTQLIAQPLMNIGMICDALWADIDNDGWSDLVLAGEWMPLKFLKNNQGIFTDITPASGINNKKGWWSSISAGDYDSDGDIDFVAGNLGENSFYKASDDFPVSVYANDFYKQGTIQCVMTTYLKDKDNGTLKEFTAHSRDDVLEQLPFIKKRFLTYKDFGSATFDKLFTQEELKNAFKYSANYFKSSFIRNNGNGTFTMEALPAIAQLSVLNGMVTDDFDKDGNLDVCINTNDFGTDPGNGRYDALNGLLLKGNGKGKFTPQTITQSGIFLPGNGRSLIKVRGAGGKYLLAASQNRGRLKVFELKGAK